MSTFESGDYRWRETYFVLFPASRRPKLEQVEARLKKLSDRFQLENLTADERGQFETVTLLAPDDYAALDISYVEGEEVVEHVTELSREMKNSSLYGQDLAKVARLPKCNARFDVMHFEHVLDAGEDEGDEMLDPSALLIVLEALAELTGGVAIDPQSGALM
jgi:hypothetical protein